MFLRGGLHHHPHHGLGSGGAQQDTTGVAELLIGGGDLMHDGRVDRRTRLVDALDVDQLLRELRHHRAEFLERTSGLDDASHQVQTGQDSVAGGGEFAHDDVAGLFPTEGEAVVTHRFEDVAVTDLGLVDAQSTLGHGVEESEIAHHGGHDGVIAESVLLVHRQSEHGQRPVPVDDVSIGVHRDAAVGVTIEGHTEGGAMGDDGLLQVLRVRRTTGLIDVQPRGVGVDLHDLRPGGFEHCTGSTARGTVGTVDDHLQASKIGIDTACDVVDVLLHQIGTFGDAADAGTHRALPFGPETFLDRVLESVIELGATPLEELDAVVGHRVVARREHDSEVGPRRIDEIGHAGGGQHAETHHIHPRRGQARHHGCFQELPRSSGVAADQGGRLVSTERTGFAEHVGCGD